MTTSASVVFGVADPRWGEAASALVAAPSGEVTERELLAHVADRLAGYKKPKRIVVRRERRTKSQRKVDMAQLRRDFLEATNDRA